MMNTRKDIYIYISNQKGGRDYLTSSFQTIPSTRRLVDELR
jgi:hypothetical protein